MTHFHATRKLPTSLPGFRSAPKAEIGRLIDDLIGTGENGLRHRYARRFGCLPVDDHFQIPFTRYAAVWLGR